MESPACTHCWSRDECAGWGMWCAWTMEGSQRISSMVSWHKANARLADPNCDTKMSARETWRPWMSTSPHRKLQPQIGLPGGRLCAERPAQLRTVTHAAGWGKASEQKSSRLGRTVGNGLHLRQVWKGLLLSYRTFQPHPTLHKNNHPERNAIVSQDWRMPIKTYY